MAQTRKQQSEIDRVLKRVQDGLIEFESIWQKVYSAPTAALKEKHEADLKKEIKRLQRYRDQIKTWLSSPEIRDKNEMLQARKQIERDMERFKVCEKETKTKAFSKEALTNTPKKKLLDKPKLEVKSWIDKRITLLKNQLGERESQLDAEQRKGKKRNKGQEEAHIDHLQRLVERYKFHIEHLEMAWEMLFEDEIVVADVEEIQEDVDYFIENNQDEDMEDFDDAYMYDLLASKRNAKPPPPPSAVLVAEDENLSDIELSDDDYDSMADDADDKEPEPPVAESPPPPPPPEPIPDDTPRRAPPKKVPAPAPSPPQAADLPPKDRRKEKTAPLEKATAAEPAAAPPPKPTPTKAERETPKKASKKKKPAVVPVQVSANYQEPSPQSAASSSRVPSVVALASSSPKLSPRALALVHRPPPEPPAASAAVAAQVPTPAPFANIVKAQQQKQAEAALARAQAESVSKQFPPSNQADHPDEAPKSNGDEAVVVAVQSLQVGGKPETTAPAPPGLRSSSPFPTGPPPGLPGPSKSTLATKLKQKQHQAAAAAEEPAADPSLLRPSRLAAVHAVTQRDASPGLKQPHLFDAPLSDEQQRNLDVLDASLRHMPTPADSDRPKQYLPRNPYHTPASWPSTPSPIFEDPTFFAKYDTDTLFFIFYFQQGTYQQYLAASQLKKQSWRYHTKYLTWFQRHKDPQVTTDEFEQGTYVYFDYDHSWCQRIKSEFTFEYRYLEDDL